MLTTEYTNVLNYPYNTNTYSHKDIRNYVQEQKKVAERGKTKKII